MKYEASGVVKEVCATQTFPSGFKKREAVIDIAEQGSKWPNEIPFQVVKDRCSILDGFTKGDSVKVTFALNGRSFTGKGRVQRFVDVKILGIEKVASQAGAPVEAISSSGETCDGGDDDMPF